MGTSGTMGRRRRYGIGADMNTQRQCSRLFFEKSLNLGFEWKVVDAGVQGGGRRGQERRAARLRGASDELGNVLHRACGALHWRLRHRERE